MIIGTETYCEYKISTENFSGDLLEKRREMMTSWATYCYSEEMK